MPNDAPPPLGALSDDPHRVQEDKVLENAPTDEESPLEKVARRHLGLRTWDRPALYRETAEAAADTDVPFWLVLLLSGAIATLGLVLDSTAVVIGAMLVAPLLGPLLGLSLALAVGDGRLFVQTAVTILLGAAGIVALAALLTWALPFGTVTDEILSRTRPTTLDLAIAVFSGAAGAVVTASREARLSASIPGVAVAVALVPPLGVAGFGLATARWSFVEGALLLFGANLAGIVLSGMLLFLLVGMNRAEVVKTARAWHESGRATGLAARLSHIRWLDRLPGLASMPARVLLVVAFMAAVAVPLSSSLAEVVRESRVSSAVAQAVDALEGDGRAFVIDQDIAYGDGAASVRLRVASESWITSAEEDAFVERVAGLAREPVSLALEQVLASSGDLEAFANALPIRSASPPPPAPQPEPAAATLATVRDRLDDLLSDLALPDSVVVLGSSIEVESGASRPRVEVVYAAPRRLPRPAEAVVARQAARLLDLPADAARVRAIVLSPRALPDSANAAGLAALLQRQPRLGLTLSGDSARVAAARSLLTGRGVEPARVRSVRTAAAPTARLTVRPDSAARRGP